MLNNLFSKKLAVFFVFVILASCLVMANENASKTTKKMVRLVDFGSKFGLFRLKYSLMSWVKSCFAMSVLFQKTIFWLNGQSLVMFFL